MCGLTGIWDTSLNELSPRLIKATDSIAYRGPDDHGYWYDEAVGLGLGHRRLSILDLSPHGAQPMLSTSQRFVMVLNGEIYNHLTLRKELSDVSWKGHSDTETLLAAFETWGLPTTLEKICGMFSLALFDRKHQTLTLIRDRMGEKPLYYGVKDGAFVFASELKPLLAFRTTSFSLNQQALFDYFRYGYVPAPHSIFEGIYKLSPGHTLTLTSKDAREGLVPSSLPYYRIPPSIPTERSSAATQDVLDTLLKQVIGEQMLSDVPVGAFLSGGIDSSLVVSLMQAQSSRPIKTFSIGFPNASFNEAPYAKAVADHLGTDHTELYVTEKEAFSVIPHLPTIYDEPFADSSQIPTFLVSRLARKKVTVSLTGDGGDELFGGYNRYRLGEKFYSSLAPLPRFFKEGLAQGLSLLPAPFLNAVGAPIPGCPSEIGNKLHRLANTLTKSPKDFFYALLTCCPENLTIFKNVHPTHPSLEPFSTAPEFLNAMMRADMQFYLPNDILAKVDRAAMANSLETRAPFLDVRIVGFSQTLPLQAKIHQGRTKCILRDLLYTYAPQRLFERPKQGFSIPIDHWLREGLQDWAQNLLTTLPTHPFLNTSLIHTLWRAHQSHKVNAASPLWVVLMYLSWAEAYKSHITV